MGTNTFDLLVGGFRTIASLGVMFYLISRRRSAQRDLAAPTLRPTLDVREIDRAINERLARSGSMRRGSRTPPPSPRSHPLWDRDLDS